MKRARAFYFKFGHWYADSCGGEFTSFLRFHSKRGKFHMFELMIGFQSAYIFEDGLTGFTEEQEFYEITEEDRLIWALE